MGGSEKSLKTTVKTLSKDYLDYVFLVIAADRGITKTTSDFLNIALSVNLPVVAIFTKIDLICQDDLGDLLYNFKCILKSEKKGKNALLVQNSDDIVSFSRNMGEGILPVFLLSNKQGKGLNLFVNFLNLIVVSPSCGVNSGISSLNGLNTNSNLNSNLNSNSNPAQFDILEFFTSQENVIIVGIVSKGILSRGINYLLGPDSTGNFKTVELKSIHCKRIDVKTVSQGQFCSLLLDETVKKENLRSGMVLLSQNSMFSVGVGVNTTNTANTIDNLSTNFNLMQSPSATKVFEAELWSMNGERKIKFTLQPIVYIPPIRQSVKIYGHLNVNEELNSNSTPNYNLYNTEEEFTISPDKPIKLYFEFMYYPEFIRTGSHLIIYESNFKIFGYLTRLIS